MTRSGRLLASGVLVLLAARLWVASRAGLVNDEAYYWQWARHLAWGYYDHPPLVAYGIALGRWLLGDSELGVRLASVVLSTAALALLYDLARLYAGPRAGLWAAGAAAVTPLLAAGGTLATPDVPFFCFWTATLALCARALASSSRAAWLGAGWCLGLGALSKYAMALLPPALLAGLLATPRGRAALRAPWPWLGALLALLLCTPLAAWTFATSGASLAHALSKGLAFGGGNEAASPLLSLGEFVGAQALVVTPILFALAVLALVRALRVLRGAPAPPAPAGALGAELLPLLVWTSALPLLVFAIASLRSESYANWAAPAYAGLFALLGGELARDLWRRRRGWVIAGFALPALATLHVHVEAVHPMVPYPKGAMTKVRDRAPLAAWAQGLRESRGARGLEADVLAAGYQTASVLAFYLPDRPHTDAPFETRGGSQYRIWREQRERGGHAERSEYAWFFSRSGRDRDGARARALLVDPELVDSHTQTRLGRELRTIRAWFGRQRPAPAAPRAR